MIASWPTHCGKSQESTEKEGMIVSHLYPAVRRPYVHEHDRFDSKPVGLKEHMIAGKFLDRGQARASRKKNAARRWEMWQARSLAGGEVCNRPIGWRRRWPSSGTTESRWQVEI
jgi:hypothetical protein